MVDPHPILVDIMVWIVVNKAFSVREHFENYKSMIMLQRAFGEGLSLRTTTLSLLQMCTVRMWVKWFEGSGSALQTGKYERRKCVKTPENVQLLRTSVERPPRRSAHKHVVA